MASPHTTQNHTQHLKQQQSTKKDNPSPSHHKCLACKLSRGYSMGNCCSVQQQQQREPQNNKPEPSKTKINGHNGIISNGIDDFNGHPRWHEVNGLKLKHREGLHNGVLQKMPVPLAPAEEMASSKSNNGEVNDRIIYKLVLTGGPCGGKTTGQERLATFFEDHGWKVFTVPETASILLNGRVRFQELSTEQSYQFQKDLMLTLLQMEQVFFNQAEMIKDRNVLIICDRGAMDPSAYLDKQHWERLLADIKHQIFELRDLRYNQVVHMVTAADGAREYYTCENNKARLESMEDAIEQDRRTREVWIGHQCLQIVDNTECNKFDDKINKLIKIVSERLPIPGTERLAKNTKKRKWLILAVDEQAFRANKFEEFFVKHNYVKAEGNDQVRIRSRRQNDHTTYTLTTRRYVAHDGTKLPEPVETRRKLDRREFNEYMKMRDNNRTTVHKKRRCFIYGNVYFQLDIYVHPLPPACLGRELMILETYSTKPQGHSEPKLPPFLTVDREITGEPAYSMYNLAGPISTSTHVDQDWHQLENNHH